MSAGPLGLPPAVFVGRCQRLPIRVSTTYLFGAQGTFAEAVALLQSPTRAAAPLSVGRVAHGTGNALTLAMTQPLIPAPVSGPVLGLIMTGGGVATGLGALAAGACLPILPL